jgi:hypothetical protein
MRKKHYNDYTIESIGPMLEAELPNIHKLNDMIDFCREKRDGFDAEQEALSAQLKKDFFALKDGKLPESRVVS